MGRLENIIARNRNPNRMRERLAVSLGFGVLVLVILALMVFTDLGEPPAPASRDGDALAPPARREPHVDGVQLRAQRPRPQAPAAPAAPPR